MITPLDRSMERIDVADLRRLGELAAVVEFDLFNRRPSGAGQYRGRLVCRALCQGAAQHYIDGVNGVKDFDVWSFYAALPIEFPPRWVGRADFGPSKFGRYSADAAQFEGRRIDVLGRSLPIGLGADPATFLAHYLAGRRTVTARALASKAVVLIEPLDRVGEIIWPTGAKAAH